MEKNGLILVSIVAIVSIFFMGMLTFSIIQNSQEKANLQGAAYVPLVVQQDSIQDPTLDSAGTFWCRCATTSTGTSTARCHTPYTCSYCCSDEALTDDDLHQTFL